MAGIAHRGLSFSKLARGQCNMPSTEDHFDLLINGQRDLVWDLV